jgi:ABC-type antimicrobial peptide transport system permease subunit
LSLVGAVCGLAVALAGGRRLEGLLFGVSPRDPVALAGAVGLLLAIAMTAGALPALRAARTDPAVALQAE